MKSKSALLVIDIQNDTLGNKEYKDTDKLMNNINDAIEYSKKSNIDIVYVKQEYSNPIDKLISTGLYLKDTDGSQFSDKLKVLSHNIFSKEKSDSFSNNALEKHLFKEEINTVYIVGADASACVLKTALAAKNRGYEVIIIKDSIFSKSSKYKNKALSTYENNGIKTIDLIDFMSVNNK